MAITSLIQGGAGSFLTLKKQSHQSPVRPLSAAKSIKFNSSNKNQCSTLRFISNGSRNRFQFQLNAASMGRVGGMWCPPAPFSSDEDCYPIIRSIEAIFGFTVTSIVAFRAWGNVFNLGAIITILALANFFRKWWNQCVTSAMKLQVCLLDKDGVLQMELNRIAETADTSNIIGLRYVLNETVVALLRRQDYFISSNSLVVSNWYTSEARTCMTDFSINERMNFEETLVNMNNNKSLHSQSQESANELHNEQIMVTLLLVPAIGNRIQIPSTSKLESDALTASLKKLPDFSHYLRAVEVLWTPQFSSSSAM